MFTAAKIGREIAANALMQLGPVREWRVKRGRTVNFGSLANSVAAFLDEFYFFRDNLGAEVLKESTIVEIGPGDSIPLGLLFLGAGAKRYVAVDRFMGDVGGPLARQLYGAIADAAPVEFKQRWQAMGIDPSNWNPEIPGSEVTIIRSSIEGARLELNADVCISFDVVEHLVDIDVAFQRIADLLAPGGITLHRVDYGPHNCWVDDSDPERFLTFSHTLWRLMGSARGYPNRKRHDDVLTAARHAALTFAERPTRYFQTMRGKRMVRDAEILAAKSARVPHFRAGPFRGGTLEPGT